MGAIEPVINGIKTWLEGFIPMLIKSLTDMVALFYTPSEGLTVLGALGLMGIAIGLVYMVINFVRRAFHF